MIDLTAGVYVNFLWNSLMCWLANVSVHVFIAVDIAVTTNYPRA